MLAAAERIADVKDLATLSAVCHRQLSSQTAPGEKVVFGEGPAGSPMMIVGEAPGAQEARTGRPFVGNAGKLLDELLGEVGLHRDRLYIANILKTRPPENRTPGLRMIARQLPFTVRQIHLVAPLILVLLGATAVRGLIDPALKITRIRGTWWTVEGVPALATFHPAAVFHDPTKRERLREDLDAARLRLAGSGSALC